MSDQRRFLWWSGRLNSAPIQDFWQVSRTRQDPSIPNLPLERAPGTANAASLPHLGMGATAIGAGGAVTVEPTTGHLYYTGRVPGVVQNITVSPTTGHLLFTGRVPGVQQNIAVAAITGHLSFHGYAPSIVQNRSYTPTTGHLVFGGYIPGVEVTNGITPLTGHLLFTGYVPGVQQPQIILPTTGHLFFDGYVPVVNQSISATPITGHLFFNGYIPGVSQTGGTGTPVTFVSSVSMFPTRKGVSYRRPQFTPVGGGNYTITYDSGVAGNKSDAVSSESYIMTPPDNE